MTTVIEIDSVSVAVRGRTILEHCNATLRAETITHLVGTNGSGKTTLIRAIAGIQRYSGSIRFDGADVARVRSNLYVCFDDAPVFPYLSGYENVRLLLGRSFSRTSLAAVAPAIADHALLRMRARSLSHGQRKRLHLVAALASGARYLIFDEALNGVDAPTVAEFATAVRERASAATVLLTGHHDDAFEGLGARRIELVDGKLSSTDALTDGVTA
ncbi:MAG TPA: ATP-binding cassette domain-containing protein [Galbitalea sp.]|nr:ATP-binding cassette domain-containing protein [Galbitalea sp.]